MENEIEINANNENINILDENLQDIKNTQTYSFPLELILPERKDRHEKCRPPREAFLFFPTQSDIIDYDVKNAKNSRRKIFEIKTINDDYDYTQYELENLDLLTREIEIFISNPKNSNSSLNKYNILKKSEVLRFLQSTSFDIKKTVPLIKDHLDWKIANFPVKINEKVYEILNSGLIYMHGRDNHFRPIIVVKVEKYLQLNRKYTLEEFINATIYFIEYIVLNCFIPGQVECWVTIADLSNVSLMFLPADMVKILNIFQCHYRARLSRVFILGMSRFLNAIWSVVKNLIDAQTNKKIRFIKDSNRSEMFEFINREQIEEKYGGLARDLNDQKGYFPPHCPSLNFFNSEEERNELLISEEKYEEMIKLGKIKNSIHPFTPPYPHKIENSEITDSIYRTQINYDSKTVYSIAKSNYEDALSLRQDEASVYENCKELKSCLGNEVNEQLLFLEGRDKLVGKEELATGMTPQDDQEMELIEQKGVFENTEVSMDEIMRSKGLRIIDVKNLPRDTSKLDFKK